MYGREESETFLRRLETAQDQPSKESSHSQSESESEAEDEVEREAECEDASDKINDDSLARLYHTARSYKFTSLEPADQFRLIALSVAEQNKVTAARQRAAAVRILADRAKKKAIEYQAQVAAAKTRDAAVSARAAAARAQSVAARLRATAIALSKKVAVPQPASQLLIKYMTGLAISCARTFGKRLIPDLVQEGFLVLLDVIHIFDGRGKFTTFCWVCMERRMKRYLANKEEPLRLPEYREQELRKILAICHKLETLFSKEPSLEEISEQANIPVSRLKDLLALWKTRQTCSLDEPSNPDDSTRLLDELEDKHDVESEAIDSELVEHVKGELNILTETDRQIVQQRFEIIPGPRSYKKIGEPLNMSEDAVRHHFLRALKKLAKHDKLGLSYIRDIDS